MDLGIQGRAAIVTGGSRGIGRETARKLLDAGARVTICARSQGPLAEMRPCGPPVVSLSFSRIIRRISPAAIAVIAK